MQRLLIVLALVSLALLPAASARAQAPDKQAEQRIDKAINEHYLATEFKQAEKVLRQALEECGGECSPAVAGKIWMYIGLIQGNAQKNQRAARKSFEKALQANPKVELDREVAAPATAKTFDKALSSASAGGSSSDDEAARAPILVCTPDTTQVETRRPIPVTCPVAPGASDTHLFYRAPGSVEFVQVPMTRSRRRMVATIPCSDTAGPGELALYVIARSQEGGKVVARWGTGQQPVVIQLVVTTNLPPPSVPGEPAPERCSPDDACEPGSPGCRAMGSSGPGQACFRNADCVAGYYCRSDVCAQIPSCRLGSDCESGACTDGLCVIPPEDEEADGGPRNRVGLHLAGDMAVISGTRMCAASGYAKNFRCFDEDGQPVDTENLSPDFSSSVSNAVVYSSTRLLLSYERMLGDSWAVGMRLGYTFRSGPDDFQPYHAELRVAHWLTQIDENGSGPFVEVGGGLGSADAKVAVTNRPDKTRADEDHHYTAYKRMGPGFGKAGVGFIYFVSPRFAAQLSLNGLLFLPAAGFVLQPSLGAVAGF